MKIRDSKENVAPFVNELRCRYGGNYHRECHPMGEAMQVSGRAFHIYLLIRLTVRVVLWESGRRGPIIAY